MAEVIQSPGKVVVVVEEPKAGMTEETAYANPDDSIHLAARRGDLRTIQKLLEAGHDPRARDEMGNPPIYYASLCGHIEVITFLKSQQCYDPTTARLAPRMGRCAMNALNLETRALFKVKTSDRSGTIYRNRPSKFHGHTASKAELLSRYDRYSMYAKACHGHPMMSGKKKRNALPTISDDPAPDTFASAEDAVSYMFDSDSEDEDNKKAGNSGASLTAEARDVMATDLQKNIRHSFQVGITLKQARRLLNWTDWNVDHALALYLEAGLADKWKTREKVVVEADDDSQWPSLSPEQPPAQPSGRTASELGSEGGWEVLSTDMGVETMSECLSSHMGVESMSDCPSSYRGDVWSSLGDEPVSYLEIAKLGPPDMPEPRSAYGTHSHSNFKTPIPAAAGNVACESGEEGGSDDDIDFGSMDDIYLDRKDGGGRIAHGKAGHGLNRRHIKKGFRAVTYQSMGWYRHGSLNGAKPGVKSNARNNLWDETGVDKPTGKVHYESVLRPKMTYWGPRRENPAEHDSCPEECAVGTSWGYKKKMEVEGAADGQ